MKVTQRSEGERLISYTKTSRKEKRKRVGLVGGDVGYNEIYQALTNIHDQIVDWQGKRKVKKQQLKR